MSDAQTEVDTRALELATKVEAKLESHEDICALRYLGIEKALGELKATAATAALDFKAATSGIYKRLWLGVGGLVAVLLGLVAWLAAFIVNKLQFIGTAS